MTGELERPMSCLRALAMVPWIVAVLVVAPALPATAVIAPATAPTARVTAESGASVAPDSIDATGERDVTAELQAFINSVPNGGVARLAQNGRYRVDGTLELTGRQGLRLDGNGSQLSATTKGERDRAHLRITDSALIVVHDLDIGGPNLFAGVDERAYRPQFAFQHGISIAGSTDVELVRVRIHDVYGDFVYVGANAEGRWSERIWIHDSVFSRNGRQGLTVTSGRDVVIERNTITSTRRATIDLEPNSPAGGALNVFVLDNQVGAGRLLFLAAAGDGPVSQVVVARNRLQGRTLGTEVSPPGADRRTGFYFVDNTSDTGAKSPAFQILRVDGLVVTGNTQRTIVRGIPLVEATNVCGLLVAENDLRPLGTKQVTSNQPPCGTPPSLNPPAPPPVAGRPVSGAPAARSAPASTSTTTAPPSSPRTRPALTTIDSDDGAGWVTITLVVLAALGAAAGLIRWVVVSERRTMRRDRRNETPPPPTP